MVTIQKQIKFNIGATIVYDPKQNRMMSQNKLIEQIIMLKKHLTTGLFRNYRGVPEKMLDNWFVLKLLRLKELRTYPIIGEIDLEVKNKKAPHSVFYEGADP